MSSFRIWEWPQKQAPEMVLKKILIKISQYSQENTCTRVSFSVKLLASASNFIKRRDSGADILLYILQNFQEHLFCRVSANDWFCWIVSLIFTVNTLISFKEYRLVNCVRWKSENHRLKIIVQDVFWTSYVRPVSTGHPPEVFCKKRCS